MTTASLPALKWQSYAGNNTDLIAPAVIDLVSFTAVSVTPSGAGVGSASSLHADGVVIDNMAGSADLTVIIGPITTLVPRYQKANLPITPATLSVQFSGTGIQPAAYFYTGTFHGEGGALNAYASQEAAQVASITGGVIDAYLDTLRWRTNWMLTAGYNLDNLQDSGFFEVLNPTNSGTALPPGEYHVTSFVSASSNFYTYQIARTAVNTTMQTFERRNLAGSGWEAWRQIDASYAIATAESYADGKASAAQTAAQTYADTGDAKRVAKTGDTMSQYLRIECSYAAVELHYPNVSDVWQVQVRDDNRAHFYNNGATSPGPKFNVGTGGDIWTPQLGDVKTYIDKAIRTDVAQNFTQAQKVQARKNIGVRFLASQVSAASSLLSSALGAVIWLSGDGYVINMPPFASTSIGDFIEFHNYGTGTITLNRAASDTGGGFYWTGNYSVSSVTIGPGQSVMVTTDGGNWVCGYRAVAPERTLNVDVAQSFTQAQKSQACSNIGAPNVVAWGGNQQNSYVKYADGRMTQRFYANVNGDQTVTFPTAFPSACVSIIATVTSAYDANQLTCQVGSVTYVNFSAGARKSGAAANLNVYFIAEGY